MIVIYLLAFYLPLEEFLLKWLPIGDQAYLLLRQLPDLVVFLMCVVLIFRRSSAGLDIPIIGKRCDIFLLLFLGWAIAAMFLNNANIPIALANIKALLRYILLVYIVLMLAPSEKQVKILFRWIGYAVVLQLVIGIFQFGGGLTTRDFLAARHVTESVAGVSTDFTGDRFEGINDLMGTMGNTIAFAMFLLVGMTIWMASPKIGALRYWLGIGALFVSIYLSGSRSVVLAALFLLLVKYGLDLGFGKLSKRFLQLLPLLIALVFLSSFMIDAESNRSFSYMFTSGYIQEALNQRLGILVYVLPKIGLSAHSLFGFSSDKFVMVEFVHANLTTVPSILVDVLQDVVEDVYWVALFIYYGWIGLVLWVLYLLGIGKRVVFIRGQFLSHTLKQVSTVALLLLMAAIPLNFLNQAFEVRVFSFYFWLMCGLTLALYRRERKMLHRGGR